MMGGLFFILKVRRVYDFHLAVLCLLATFRLTLKILCLSSGVSGLVVAIKVHLQPTDDFLPACICLCVHWLGWLHVRVSTVTYS